MSDDLVTRIGTVCDDPVLRFTSGGKAVCDFDLKVVKGKAGPDQTKTFYKVTVWEVHGEHVAESLRGGDRAIVFGKPSIDTWEDKTSGEEKTKPKITAYTVGPSLEYATAEVTRVEHNPVRDAPAAAAAPVDLATF